MSIIKRDPECARFQRYFVGWIPIDVADSARMQDESKFNQF